MDFALNETQRMMIDAAQRLNEKFVEPLLNSHDKRRGLPKDAVLKVLQKASELGLTSARIPEKDGGAGLSMLDYGMMVEQLPPSIMLIVQPHEATSTRINFGGTAAQRERFLPDLIAGRRIGATGSTEPDHGSDPRGIKTTATPGGDHVVLNGRKQWISNAPVCDVIHVTCRIPDGNGGYRMGRVLVDRNETPFEVREVEMHGLCQAPLGEVLFENCKVPLANVCPDSADTARLLTITWLVNRPTVGLMAIGLAQRALKMACEYAGMRKQFGKLYRFVSVDPERPGRHGNARCHRSPGLLQRAGRPRPRRACERAVRVGQALRGGRQRSRDRAGDANPRRDGSESRTRPRATRSRRAVSDHSRRHAGHPAADPGARVDRHRSVSRLNETVVRVGGAR